MFTETAMYNPNRETIAAIDNILRGLRHELSSLTTVLLLEIEQLEQMADRRDPELRTHLNELRSDMGDLSQLITRLRKYPAADFMPIPVDLIGVISEAVAQASPLARSMGLSIYSQLPHNVHWVAGNEQELIRAFYALIENAIEATVNAGSTQPVEVSVREGKQLLTLVIADRGPGFTFKAVQNGMLLKPGYTTKQESGATRGLGMGLLAVQAAVELHGGTFRLQTRQKGGTLAILTLPTIDPTSTLDSDLRWYSSPDHNRDQDLQE